MDKNKIGLVFAAMAGLSTQTVAEDFRFLPYPSDLRYPDYVYFSSGKAYSWPNGVIYWKYNPSGQPSAFTTDKVVQILKASQAKWEQVCGIRFEYQGTTTAAWGASDGVNVMAWGSLDGDTMGLTQNYFYSNGTTFFDTDVEFDPVKIQNPAYLEAIATHEFGHSLGLNHSEVQESIMFAKPYHSAGYQMILRTDDVNGCQSLYGATNSLRAAMPINNYADRLFNFAEDFASAFLLPRKQGGTQFSAEYGNAPYRAYETSASLLGIYQGSVYYSGPASGNQWMDQGSVEYWMPFVANAGYY